MKILVTGATGFIGKHLVKELVGKGHKVMCLVRKTSRKKDINYLKKLEVELFNGELTDKNSLKGICKGIDIIYHLTGVLGSFNFSEKLMFDINVKGTENILNESKEGKVKKFIFCSSAGVLGPIIKGGGSSPYSPSNLYEKTKVEAEKLVLKSKLDYIIMRSEFVYGPMDNHVLPLFKAIKERLSWLIVGFIGAMLIAFYIGLFEETLQKYLIIAAFVPAIVYLSDALGTQIQTIFVRDLAVLGKAINFKKYFLKQIFISFFIASIIGILLFSSIYLFYGLFKISLIISLAAFVALIITSFTALIITLLIKKFNFDPALGSGPIATIISDMSSVIIYFLIVFLLI